MDGNWDDIIAEAESERFVGREKELSLFHIEVQKARPRFLIFYIFGQGGVGKTTLLHQYRSLARETGFFLTDTDETDPQLRRVGPGRSHSAFSE